MSSQHRGVVTIDRLIIRTAMMDDADTTHALWINPKAMTTAKVLL